MSQQYIVPTMMGGLSSSSLGISPKKRKKWDVNLGLHTIFFVPKADRTFQIQNSDFQFF